MRKMLSSVQGTGNHTEKKEQTWSQAPWGSLPLPEAPSCWLGTGEGEGWRCWADLRLHRAGGTPSLPKRAPDHLPALSAWPGRQAVAPFASSGLGDQGLQARGLREFWEAAQSWSVQYPTAHPMKSMFTTTDVQQPKPDMKQF